MACLGEVRVGEKRLKLIQVQMYRGRSKALATPKQDKDHSEEGDPTTLTPQNPPDSRIHQRPARNACAREHGRIESGGDMGAKVELRVTSRNLRKTHQKTARIHSTAPFLDTLGFYGEIQDLS